ncbi:hypothetical protein [Paenibacillus campi]|uniref:hypothetical protein n=1 Tax=Paenibacillus campi TaxID=3106031 RepID=UPI002AFF65AF|nr:MULTISPECIES: hypothetical protein [unclassified Paenibacillus]
MATTTSWDDGKLVTLNPGDTVSNTKGLNKGQLYALVFYNSSNKDASTDVSITTSQSTEPITVTVPGTTAQQGLASLLFFNGTDTDTISAAVTQNQPGGEIQAFIASVKMPTNTTGINNTELPSDGQLHLFNKFTRFYSVPGSHWYQGTIKSLINQFISVQFKEQSAIVNVVNAQSNPESTIQKIGIAKEQVTINFHKSNTLQWNFQGNGNQIVWFNADSAQNSGDAAISLQSLQNLFE